MQDPLGAQEPEAPAGDREFAACAEAAERCGVPSERIRAHVQAGVTGRAPNEWILFRWTR